MRDDTLILYVDPIRTEMTGTQQIPSLHVCDQEESKSKEFLADESLVRVCYKDESESESIIAQGSSTDESKSECVHKSINKNEEKM